MKSSWAGPKQLWWTWACLRPQHHILQNMTPILFMLLHYLPYPGFLLLWIMESFVQPYHLIFLFPEQQLEKIADRNSHPRANPLLSCTLDGVSTTVCLSFACYYKDESRCEFVYLCYLNVCPQTLSTPVCLLQFKCLLLVLVYVECQLFLLTLY